MFRLLFVAAAFLAACSFVEADVTSIPLGLHVDTTGGAGAGLHNWADIDIGEEPDEDSRRYIVVVAGGSSDTANQQISWSKLDGVAMTLAHRKTHGGGACSAVVGIFYAEVPTGTTADLQVRLYDGNNAANAWASVFVVYVDEDETLVVSGIAHFAGVSGSNGSGNPGTIDDLVIPAGGVAFAGTATSRPTGKNDSATWTGLVEVADAVVEAVVGSLAAVASLYSEAGETVDVSCAVDDPGHRQVLVAVVFTTA